MKNKWLTKILLVIILILAFGLRIYKLSGIPPSLSWDEAAVGVNSAMIADYGRDEYGEFLPLYFKSFGDDKHPVHIYFTVLSVKMLGLNEFAVRLPSALFGVLNVLLIFFLGKILFKTNLVGLSASFFLAISPYNIHFSRFNHEVNFMLFFFMLGFILFLLSVKLKGYFFPLSIISFAVCFITYHPAKVIVPLFLFLLVLFYVKKLPPWPEKAASLIIFLLFIFLLFLKPQLLGTARISQNTLNQESVQKTYLFRISHNEVLGRFNLIIAQYLSHFTPQFLFIRGDKNPRLSSQTGQFYPVDLILLLLGLFYILYKRSKEGFLILTWVLLAPIPSSLVAESPHAARASFMIGSWHLISALGVYYLSRLIKNSKLKLIIFTVLCLILLFSLFRYLSYYFGEYVSRYAIEWQYGMKQIVNFVKDNPRYTQIYMTDKRSQPYIFFLYYLKTPLPDYLNTVLYNNAENKSYNLVSSFDKYYFGGTNTVEKKPESGVLYILTPSEYDGLMYKSLFNIKKIIYYPNNTTAFYVIN